MKTTNRIEAAAARMLHSVSCGFSRPDAYQYVVAQMGLDPIECQKVTVLLLASAK